VARQIVLNPLIMSACAGALAAALHLEFPVAVMNTLAFLQNAAAPVALFVLGVTVALRPFGRIPWEVPGVIAVKLLLHPLIVFALMLLLGPFTPEWAVTAVLMASLPPALNAFVIARLGRGVDRDVRFRHHADRRDVADQVGPAGVSLNSRRGRHEGASPSRMARRRSGPSAPMRCSPAARNVCMGRKSDSSERFARSIAKIRLATSVRRAELNRDSTEGEPGSSPCSIASRAMPAISAASRSPMFKPCAPIGGSTWAASPTSATRCLANCLGCSIASGNR
jgi:hypothetical protein